MLFNLRSVTGKLSSRIKRAFIAVSPWLITGIVMVAAIVIITPRSAVIEISDEAWLNSSTAGISGQPQLPVDPPAQDSRSEGFGENPAQGVGSAQPQVDSISAPNIDPPGDSTGSGAISFTATEPAFDAAQMPGTPSDNLSPAESHPYPVAGSEHATVTNMRDIAASSKSADSAGAATAAMKESAYPAAGTEPQETIRNSDPWVINLSSSHSRDDAERFRAWAGARGIAAVLYRVTVKGNDYWRVQVSGFASAAEAKAEAGLIKEKLGNDDIWVVTQ
jgi:cell division septation protein DedD